MHARIVSWPQLVLAAVLGVPPLNLPTMESHLLNEAFHDSSSSRLNVELDAVSSGFSWPFRRAMETLSRRSQTLSKSVLKVKTTQNEITPGKSLKSP